MSGHNKKINTSWREKILFPIMVTSLLLCSGYQSYAIFAKEDETESRGQPESPTAVMSLDGEKASAPQVGNIMVSEKVPRVKGYPEEEEVFLHGISITELKHVMELPDEFEQAIDLAVQMNTWPPQASFMPSIVLDPGDPFLVWENGSTAQVVVSTRGWEAEWYSKNIPSNMNATIDSNDGFSAIMIWGKYITIDGTYYMLGKVHYDYASGLYTINLASIMDIHNALGESGTLDLTVCTMSGATDWVSLNWTVLDRHMWFDQAQYEVELPAANSEAVVIPLEVTYDEDMLPDNPEIIFSLDGIYSGVSINSQMGAVTVSTDAEIGTVAIKAQCGKFIAESELIITAPDDVPAGLLFQENSYRAFIPEEGSATVVATANVVNSSGQILADKSINYSLGAQYQGVFVNAETGTITIVPQAEHGMVTVVATYDALTATVVLNLRPPNDPGQILNFDIVEGQTYYISIAGAQLAGTDDVVAAVYFDSEMLDIVDVAAHTYSSGTLTGSAERECYEILDLSDGRVLFSFSKSIPNGKLWSGLMTILELEARSTGNTEVFINEEEGEHILQGVEAQISGN